MTPPFLRDGGRAGEAARSVDWSATSVGPPESWPVSLQTMVGVLLKSLHPMFLWWGDDLVQFYNDAYLPSFGEHRHPRAMGQPGAACWPEIWHIIGPQIDVVRSRGESCWFEDALVPIDRNGRREDVYWSYSYSPVYDGEVVRGVLVVCSETTKRVLAERRQSALRPLAASLLLATTDADAMKSVARWAGDSCVDVSFAALFLDGELSAHHGLRPGELASLEASAVPLRGSPRAVALGSKDVAEPGAPRTAWLVPLEEESGATLLLGPSESLPFDASYIAFFGEVAELLAAARTRTRAQRDLLMQAPVATALLVGPDHVFTVANQLYVAMAGREVVGKTYAEAFPELRETSIAGVLRGVYERGEDFSTDELRLPLARASDGVIEDRFFRFSLQPVRDTEHRIYGIMAVALDIHEQVTAKRQAEAISEERAHLLADAQAAARAKDEFLAVLGHELRNPLAPIVTALGLMDLSGVREGVRERAIIARQARHLTLLVDDLLDVSRVAQGKITLQRRRGRLDTIVAGAVEIASPTLEAKRHDVRVEIDPPDLLVFGDELRLRQVLANLLTNAARYTPPGGEVRVRATSEGEEIVIRVRDNGRGIRPDTLPHLFDAFFQGPGARDRGEGGLGLGLALVKALTELHGGSVALESEGVGKGTTATVRLPLAAAEVARPARGGRSPTPPPARIVVLPRVLLVDDNADLVELFAAVLEKRGFEVAFAHDGPAALRGVASFKPEVAVLDIGLPEMDGYELAWRLRAAVAPANIRLIAMSGYGQEGDRARSLAAGFAEHVVKPVDSDALVNTILAAWAAPAPP